MAKHKKKKWSQDVTENSDAMDLEDGVFKQRSAKTIADSIKRSAEASDRRKSNPFRSAMSMLTFYVNRGGKDLPKTQKAVLERAKDELRAHDVLKGLRHFDRRDMTNIPVDTAQWAAIKTMLSVEPGFEPVLGD